MNKYSDLKGYSFSQLQKMANKMDLKPRRSRNEYIRDITAVFDEYNEYKKNKVDKYTKIKQLGKKGKEGTTYLVSTSKGKEYAMKTFRKNKSSDTLRREYYLQKKASSVGVCPRVVEYDTISKYIVMEKLDGHLINIMGKQKGNLKRGQQMEIIELFKKLDEVGVFHGDSNILNYMVKNKEIYLIDFGFAKEITKKLEKKLGTTTPNLDIMTLGLILKLKEFDCPPSAWKYLKNYISKSEIERFKI